MDAQNVDYESLRTLNLPRLLDEWERRLQARPPALRSTDFLARLLAWFLQQRVHGGLSPTSKRRLRRIADALERDPNYAVQPVTSLKPGTVLCRDWQGLRHEVSVVEEGFEYHGKRYASLSEVARAITGVRWSGPVFFGLKRATHKKAKCT